VIVAVSRTGLRGVILDTNVLLSGIFFGGVPGRVLAAWHEDRFELILSPAILAEYRRVGDELAAEYTATRAPLTAILTLVTQRATIVDAPDLQVSVCADPSDDKFLACAVAARAPLIVSGDKHLLAVNGWGEIAIITPRQFADRYLARDTT